MSDLATLGLRFETQNAEPAVATLDKIADKATKAEKATDQLSGASKRSGSAIAQMIANIERAVTEMRDLQVGMAEGAMAAIEEARALDKVKTSAGSVGASLNQATTATNQLTTATNQASSASVQFSHSFRLAQTAANSFGQAGKATAVMLEDQSAHVLAYRNHLAKIPVANDNVIKSSKLVRNEMLNLTRQFSDVGVTAAMGMSPLMILIQQGPQIAESLALMKREGVGLAGAMRMAAGAAAPLLVALAPLIVIGAAAAAGFALLNRELSKGYPKDITVGLGLTAEQLERVEHKTVTMGDTFKATLDVMGKYLTSGPVGAALKWLGDVFTKTLDGMAKVAFEGAAIIVGTFLGALKTIQQNWRNFPAVIGDAVKAAANVAIDGVQRMINATVIALNTAKHGASLFNPGLAVLPDIPQADLSRFKLQISGAAEFVGRAFGSNVKQSIEDVRGGMRRIGDEIRAGAIKIAQDRALKEAGKAPKAKTAKDAKDEADAFADVVKQWAAYLDRAADAAREWERAIANIKPIADIGLMIEAKEAEAFADKMAIAADDMASLADRARDLGDALADGFGRGGAALGGLIQTMATYQSRQADVFARQADDVAKFKDALADASKLKPDEQAAARAKAEAEFARDRIKSERQLRDIEVDRNVASLRAFKSLFKEKSAAYKVLTGLEIAYQAIQLAGHIKAMALVAVHTAKSIASALARGVADAAAGAAKMFAMLGPFAFPVVAAMVGVLAALGLKLAGGGGSGPSLPSAEERQAAQGTGSVLGDADAKSESIARSLELVEAHTNKSLEFFNPMVKYLRSIDSQIGALTAALARQLGGSTFDTSKLGLGSNTTLSSNDLFGGIAKGIPIVSDVLDAIGGLLSKIPVIGGLLKSLFGTKTTRTLLDQGLAFDAATLEDVLNNGISGSTYQTIETKKKKKLFGVGVGGSTKTEDITAALDAQLGQQIGLLIGSIADSVKAAAVVLGVEGADATLKAFQIELGKISLKGLDAQGVSDALNAVFSKLGDQMAGAVVPALEEFQKAGEGLFETLVRVAREYQVVDVTLASIGKTFGQVGLSSVAAREHLIDLFGSLDAFVEQTNFFAENFLSDIERLAPIQAAVEKELTRLGLSGINTKQAFKDLVLSLDVSTEAGAEMYAALLAVAPAFLKVVDFTTEGSKDLSDAADDLKSAYKTAADALQSTIDKFRGFADSLRRFRESLSSGPNALLSPEAQYNATKAAFEQTAAKARLGDEQALSDLQGVSQAYLDASKAYYASSGAYFQDLEAVKQAVQAAEDTAGRTASNAEQQLSVMKSQMDALGLIEQHTKTFAEALTAYLGTLGTAAAANGGTGLPAFQGGSGTGGIEALTAPPPANDTGAPTGGGTASDVPMVPDYAGYVQAYEDLRAAYQVVQPQFGSEAAYGQFHWNTYGQAEGRTLPMMPEPAADPYAVDPNQYGGYYGFATGGQFTVGGSGGPDSQNFGPVNLSPGEVINVRRPSDLANDNTAVEALLAQVCEKLDRLEQAEARGAAMVAQVSERGFSTLDRSVRDRGKTQRLAGKGG